tara:strand:- start:2655 stop:3707 length:1053 start_codon:yes stop_codon:yes gene_type:complete
MSTNNQTNQTDIDEELYPPVPGITEELLDGSNQWSIDQWRDIVYEPYKDAWISAGYSNVWEVRNELGGLFQSYENTYGGQSDKLIQDSADQEEMLEFSLNLQNDQGIRALEGKNWLTENLKNAKIAQANARMDFENKLFNSKKQQLLLTSLDKISQLENKYGKSGFISGDYNSLSKNALENIKSKVRQGTKANEWRQSELSTSIHNIGAKADREMESDRLKQEVSYNIASDDTARKLNFLTRRTEKQLSDWQDDWLVDQYNIIAGLFERGIEYSPGPMSPEQEEWIENQEEYIEGDPDPILPGAGGGSGPNLGGGVGDSPETCAEGYFWYTDPETGIGSCQPDISPATFN